MVVVRKIGGKPFIKLALRNSCKLLGALLISALIPSIGWSQQPVDPNSNLLVNGDFSKGTDGWEFQSWGKQGQNSVVKPEDVLVDGLKPRPPGQPAPDPSEIHHGKPSLKLDNMNPDDTEMKQKVKVKPATRYRLSGWAKVKGVEAKNMKGKIRPVPPSASWGHSSDRHTWIARKDGPMSNMNSPPAPVRKLLSPLASDSMEAQPKAPRGSRNWHSWN